MVQVIRTSVSEETFTIEHVSGILRSSKSANKFGRRWHQCSPRSELILSPSHIRWFAKMNRGYLPKINVFFWQPGVREICIQMSWYKFIFLNATTWYRVFSSKTLKTLFLKCAFKPGSTCSSRRSDPYAWFPHLDQLIKRASKKSYPP